MIAIGINDPVCDRDQASVGYTTRYATRKATAIRQVYHGVCHARTRVRPSVDSDTWHAIYKIGDRDRVVGFD